MRKNIVTSSKFKYGFNFIRVNNNIYLHQLAVYTMYGWRYLFDNFD